MRKFLSMLLAVLMLLSVLPVTALAADGEDVRLFTAEPVTGLQYNAIGDNIVYENTSSNNNSFAKAHSVSFANTNWGYLSSTDSNDYYKFTVSRYSEVGIAFIASLGTLGATLYNGSQKKIADIEYDSYDGNYNYVSFFYLDKGTYYLKVHGTGLANYSSVEYLFYMERVDHNHTAASAVRENYTAPTVTKAGGYDTVTYCSACGTEMSRSHTNLAATGNVIRVSGKNRSLTAIAAAKELKNGLRLASYDYIILASGTNFADALAGSYLAAVKTAPILLHTKTAVQDNLNYILENLSVRGTVYILGGTAAVPQEVEDLLTVNEINVVRLSGKDRFATNIKILEEAGVSPNQEILVCTGYNFADSLSASATGLPILLVNSKKNVLTEDQILFFEDTLYGADLTMTVLGGTGAVSEAMANLLDDYGTIDRISGKNRYITSRLIAERYFENSKAACIAYGNNFPDGLAGGPLTYYADMPLLLVKSGSEGEAAKYVSARNITQGYVMGGTGVISNGSVSKVFD